MTRSSSSTSTGSPYCASYRLQPCAPPCAAHEGEQDEKEGGGTRAAHNASSIGPIPGRGSSPTSGRRLTPVPARLLPSRPQRPHSPSQPDPEGTHGPREGIPGDRRRRSSPTSPTRPRSAEFTPRAVILGMVFGIIFGAVTVYVGLRAGLTVSASIPIAVLSISLLRALGQGHHPREQHRPDDGLGRRVGGGRRDLHAARADLPGLPARVLADLPARADRRAGWACCS